MPLQIDILEENRHCCEEATHFNLQNGGVTVNFEGKDLYPGKLYIAMTYAGLYVVAGDMYSPIPHCPFCNFSVSDSQIPIQQTEKVFTKNITA